MKSFRLDPDSVTDFLNSWPALVTGALLVCLSAYLGIAHLWGRTCAVLICGIYGGYLLRGVTARRHQEKYPGARRTWLLTVGMTTAALGVATRMAFPKTQGMAFDLAWLGVTFFSILGFVVINRKNVHVTR